MKKSDLKQIIKECVKEILFEEGVLSNIVAEVAIGITKAQALLTENSEIKPEKQEKNEDHHEDLSKRKQTLETKRKMLNAAAPKLMRGIFENVDPIREAGSPGGSSTSAASPLAGHSATDAGIDIAGLLSISGQKWKKLK